MPRKNKRSGSKFGGTKRIDPTDFGVKKQKPQKIEPTPTSIRREKEEKLRERLKVKTSTVQPQVGQTASNKDRNGKNEGR